MLSHARSLAEDAPPNKAHPHHQRIYLRGPHSHAIGRMVVVERLHRVLDDGELQVLSPPPDAAMWRDDDLIECSIPSVDGSQGWKLYALPSQLGHAADAQH